MLLLLFASGCPDVTVPVGRFACTVDEDCPPGQPCGVDGICGSTFGMHDAGMDAGMDASIDAGMDAAVDADGMDSGPFDAGVDAGRRDSGARDSGPGRDAGIMFDASPGFPTMFRITSLSMRDPHVFYNTGSCSDVTSVVNDAITSSLDFPSTLTLGVVMRPYSSTTPDPYWMSIIYPICTSETSCTLASVARRDDTVGTNQSSGTCLAPIGGTTSGYAPTITEPSGPCYSTLALPLKITLFGAELTLYHGRVAARYSGTDRMIDGLLYGFLTRTEAAAARFSTGPISGRSVESVLSGGAGCCNNPADDTDTSPLGVDGWWMYFNFEADRIASYDE